MGIKSVYKKYFQKSKVFLYPLLGIKRGTSVIPSETYLAWNDSVSPNDMKLVCLYHPREDVEYKKFEKNILLKHNRLHDCIMVDKSNRIFVFDFSDLEYDWQLFLDGKYSMISTKVKGDIMSFFNPHTGNYVYMKSYLYPEKYFEDYANCLNVDVKMIESVGELCSKPDLEKEKLVMEVANLDNIKIID